MLIESEKKLDAIIGTSLDSLAVLSEIPGFDIAKYILTTVLILTGLALILVVMMQRPKQDGIGAAFGNETMQTIAGPAISEFLRKGTVFLGTMLFLLTFALSMLVTAGAADKKQSLQLPEKPATELRETQPKE